MQKVIIFTSYSGKGRLIIQAKRDDEDWVTLIPSLTDLSEYIFPSGFLCKRLRFRIMESSSNQTFSFDGLDVYFTAMGLVGIKE